MRKQLSQPSFTNGFARSKGESVRPDLWADGGQWYPCLGYQGPQKIGETIVYEHVANKHGVLTPHALYPTTDSLLPSYSIASKRHVLYSNTSTGVGGGVKCGVSPFAGLAGMTFEVLVYLTTVANNQMIAEDGSAYNTNCFYLYVNATGTRLEYTIYTSNYTTVSTAISANTWLHVFATWSGTDGLPRLWTNGAETVGGTARTGTLYATPNAELCLFGRPNTSSQIVSLPLYSGAMIAFWRCYKRQLLANEILALTADPLFPLRRKKLWSMYVPAASGGFKPYWYRNKNILIGA